MKNTLLALLGVAALGLGPGASAQSFVPGNLAVLRLGDGTQPLANTGNTIFIDQYSTNGALVSSAAVPDSGPSALLLSGTASSEGGLTRSADRSMLAFMGYNTNRGSVTTSLANLAGTTVPRAVAALSASRSYSLVEASTTLYSANNPRCAVTDGTNSFWTAGPSGGIFYLHPPSAPVLIQTSAGGNDICTRIIAGTLFFSTQKGTIGLYTFTGGGLPTTPAPTNLLFTTGASGQPNGFDLDAALSVAYVADGRGTAGGIQKWVNSAGAWTLAYTFATGAGAFGVAVDFSGANPVIYATTGESAGNRLVCIVDTNAAATVTTLATAPANEWFRGLDFAPDLRPLILTQPQSQVVTNGSDVSFTVTASSPYALGYQWQKDGSNILGATTTALNLHGVTLADQAAYRAVVTNQYGSATSADALLTVNTVLIPPAFTAEPQSQSSAVGDNVTFAVSVSGTAPFHYQWQHDLADLSGETNASLALTCVGPTAQGSYRVRVTNPGGSTNSQGAVLTVLAPADSYVAYTHAGSVYAQNFDSLPNPGLNSINADNPITLGGVICGLANPFDLAFPVVSCGAGLGGLGLSNTLAGWYGAGELAAQFGASAGDQSTGGLISFGSTNSLDASTNRALGLLATSSSGSTVLGVKLLNLTTTTLTQMTLHFTGELWRQAAVPKTLAFAYWIDPSATNGLGTNLTAALTNLSVEFPTNPAAATPIPVDGTAPTNQLSLGVSGQAITNWPPGAALWLIWQMTDPTGKGQGLAIDNLTFSAWPAPAVPVSLTLRLSGTNAVLSWPVSASGYALQANSALTQGSGWSRVAQPVVVTNSLNSVTVPLGAAGTFYRLQWPF